MVDHNIAEEVSWKAATVLNYELSYEPACSRLMELAEGYLTGIYGPYGCGKSRLLHSISVEA